MKIAKKVLAVVMALAMVGCFAAMAFAAPAKDAKFTVKAEGEKFIIVYAENLVGLKSANIELKYDPAVVASVKALPSDGEKAIINAGVDNKLSIETNTNVDGVISSGFFFKDNLWDNAKWGEAFEENGEELNFDAAKFPVAKYIVKFESGKTMADLVIDAKVTASEPKDIKIEGIAKAETKPAETKPAETKPAETKPAETKPAETTKPAVKPDGPATGDTGILAIAAGVVALAGAAFVISKKRK